ncbi:MAG TPA: PspC domain-containing protein [Streptosporangiaceae bacterium]|nr:PspC domain-containing protein [Streptosporangiaceae bacterium]
MNAMNGSKRLYRRRKGRMVAGVCAGLSDYFGLDVNLIRLLFAVATVFGGLGVLVYVVAWAIVPEEGEEASIAETFINQKRGG